MRTAILTLLCLTTWAIGQQQQPPPHFLTRPGEPVRRVGDEIIVCGQLFHTGAPVVTWLDAGGYDSYRLGKRFPESPGEGPKRVAVGIRSSPLTDDELEYAKSLGGNVPLAFLQEHVDQFVLHYDVCGLSKVCFAVLHDGRGLSVHFMLDIDGTLYQTMDLKDQAAHATIANGRSIGIEIANMGAYPIDSSPLPLNEWYTKDGSGTRITIPSRFGDGGVRTPNFVGRPSRPDLVAGVVQGKEYRQYDLTPQQYDTLTKLTATLCTIFPKITADYPRLKTSLGAPATAATMQPTEDPREKFSAIAAPGEAGTLIPHTLSAEQFDNYQGVLGHYHVQLDKQDPGPAMQWERLLTSARSLMTSQARAANMKARGHPAKHIPSTRPALPGGRNTTSPTTTTTTTTPPAVTPPGGASGGNPGSGGSSRE